MVFFFLLLLGARILTQSGGFGWGWHAGFPSRSVSSQSVWHASKVTLMPCLNVCHTLTLLTSEVFTAARYACAPEGRGFVVAGWLVMGRYKVLGRHFFCIVVAHVARGEKT